ncbi:MAG TPA: hypothetical protein VL096_01140 [Pirellulaceae bacterium]|nr:hypothetical protein [Pirellulaceae bacterium]
MKKMPPDTRDHFFLLAHVSQLQHALGPQMNQGGRQGDKRIGPHFLQ